MSEGILQDLQFHLKIRKGDVGRYVLICGDPSRTDRIAKYLENAKEIAYNREYKIWTGELDGKKVSVCSHGIGGPSTAIALEELYNCGADTFIRIGTCGGMQTDVLAGDLVIANASIRKEGTTREYAPIEYPAVSHFGVTTALAQSATELGYAHHVGVVECKDSFYGQHMPENKPVADDLLYKWQAWIALGCLASEMESAALYIVSAFLGARAGTILHVINNQERIKQGLSNEVTEDTEKAIEVAISAIRKLIEQDR